LFTDLLTFKNDFLSEFKIIVAFIFMVLNYIIISKAILKYKQINEEFAKITIDK
jgi:hypothetical protein